MSGKEFPNNWEEIRDAPDEMFETCTYEEMEMGMANWSLPTSHQFLIRVYNKRTNKVTEKAYMREHSVRKRLLKECQDADNEILLCDNYSIHLIKQHNESDYD